MFKIFHRSCDLNIQIEPRLIPYSSQLLGWQKKPKPFTFATHFSRKVNSLFSVKDLLQAKFITSYVVVELFCGESTSSWKHLRGPFTYFQLFLFDPCISRSFIGFPVAFVNVLHRNLYYPKKKRKKKPSRSFNQSVWSNPFFWSTFIFDKWVLRDEAPSASNQFLFLFFILDYSCGGEKHSEWIFVDTSLTSIFNSRFKCKYLQQLTLVSAFHSYVSTKWHLPHLHN